SIDYVGEGPVSKLLLAPGQVGDTWMMSTESSAASRDITIRHLQFDGSYDRQGGPRLEHQTGIFLYGVEDCLVERCLFHDIRGDAVYAHAGDLGVSSQVIVENNEMHSLGRVGVNFQHARDSIARGNFIHDSPNNALKMEKQDVGEPATSG